MHTTDLPFALTITDPPGLSSIVDQPTYHRPPRGRERNARQGVILGNNDGTRQPVLAQVHDAHSGDVKAHLWCDSLAEAEAWMSEQGLSTRVAS